MNLKSLAIFPIMAIFKIVLCTHFYKSYAGSIGSAVVVLISHLFKVALSLLSRQVCTSRMDLIALINLK